MRLFRTLTTRRPTFLADGSLDVYAPTSWRKMTQQQLRYVLTVLSLYGDEPVVAKVYMLMRLSGIHVEGETLRLASGQPKAWSCWVRTAWWKSRRWVSIEAWQVQSLIRQFDFIDPFDGMDVRLERIHGCRAADDLLDHYPFGDYLYAEAYYQQSLLTGDSRMVEQLARFLYFRTKRHGFLWLKKKQVHPVHLSLTPAEQLGTLRWFAHVKSFFAERWPDFFRRVSVGAEEPDIDVMASMNAQIRALTDGDVTKEETVRRLPCWRALTELNEKAREAREFHEKYDKK
mgnify:CR=1 FL=1